MSPQVWRCSHKLKYDIAILSDDAIRTEPDFSNNRWWTAELFDYMNKITSSEQISSARSNVRAGTVKELSISSGLIEAKFEDKRKSSYHVRLCSQTPSDAILDEIKRRISKRVIYAAELLAGGLPFDFKGIFNDSGASLIPWNSKQSRFVCSCSYSNRVCSHTLTVLYVLSGVFDRDPFLLLKFAGIEREEFLSALLAKREEPDDFEVCSSDFTSSSTCADDELPCGEDSLYGTLAALSKEDITCCNSLPCTSLFDFPLWRGEMSFKDSLEPYYRCVKKR